MNLLIFSGTSEGHALCRFLSARGAEAQVFVATEYGQAVMEPLPGIQVHAGRLDQDQMAARLAEGDLVVDATHPYAPAVSANLRAACLRAGAEYLRLLRPRTEAEGAVVVPDTAAAARWLAEHPGRALLTTGSKELAAFAAVPDFAGRLFARVLPAAGVLEKCLALGFPASHIVAMQGPFSRELNAALLRQVGADILVTKDTGQAGGLAEKLAAARDTGATVLLIARPSDEQGRTLEQVQDELSARLGLQAPPKFPLFVSLEGQPVLVVGAGQIAARRIGVLNRFGAKVKVVAPEKRAAFDAEWLARPFRKEDLDGVKLAVAASDDRLVNRQVGEESRARGILVSVADCAGESTFFFPAVCEGGGLIAGVVSRGENHRKVAQTAARIRTLMEETP